MTNLPPADLSNHLRAGLLAVACWACATAASATTVIVPGHSDPYLSGMPDGSSNGSDTAPDQSPVLVSGITLVAGGALTFTNAVGGTSRGGGCALAAPYGGCDAIDGAEFFSHSGGNTNGIAGVRAPISALVGVFLGADQPSLTAAPANLDFQALGLDFASLSPELKQVFFIGDGLTATAEVQTFYVPTGATRLYLGTMDGYGWYNNSGAITVDVSAVPEPGTLALMGLGVAALGAVARRRR
jgi:hypothetical protein